MEGIERGRGGDGGDTIADVTEDGWLHEVP